MSLRGSIASSLWQDSAREGTANSSPVYAATGAPNNVQRQQPVLLEDVFQLLRAERAATDAALAEVRKQLDWRFVHFAEEFKVRVDGLDSRIECLEGRAGTNDDARRGRGTALELERTERALGLRLGEAEVQLVEVQRWTASCEAQLREERLRRADAERRATEAEVWLARLDSRLVETEARLAVGASELLRSSVDARLAPVEPLSLEDLGSARSLGEGTAAMAPALRGFSGLSIEGSCGRGTGTTPSTAASAGAARRAAAGWDAQYSPLDRSRATTAGSSEFSPCWRGDTTGPAAHERARAGRRALE